MSIGRMELGAGKSTFELAPSPGFFTDRTIAVNAVPYPYARKHLSRPVCLHQYQ